MEDITTKICSKCKQVQCIANFTKSKSNKDGFNNYCKLCFSEIRKQWNLSHPNYGKQYYQENRLSCLINNKKYYQNNKVKCNKDNNKYVQNRCNHDHTFKMKLLIRRRMLHGIKSKKSQKSRDLLCCDWQFAHDHLEKQFRDGMTWENHGKFWQIDHIIPISFFDLTDFTEQKLAFHYGNLQPLLVKENLSKNDSIPIETNFRY